MKWNTESLHKPVFLLLMLRITWLRCFFVILSGISFRSEGRGKTRPLNLIYFLISWRTLGTVRSTEQRFNSRAADHANSDYSVGKLEWQLRFNHVTISTTARNNAAAASRPLFVLRS
jgi:hypothetical protein